MLRLMADSTKPAISKSFLLNSSSSTVKRRTELSKSAGDVLLGFPARRVLEDLVRPVVFNETAEQKEPREVSNARSLLHIVRDDHQGALIFEAEHQFFNL